MKFTVSYTYGERHLYLMGGYNNNSPFNKVSNFYRYCISNDSFTSLPNMNNTRAGLASFMSGFKSFLYAIGGDNGYTIERYNMQNSIWKVLDIKMPDHFPGIQCFNLASQFSLDYYENQKVLIFGGALADILTVDLSSEEIYPEDCFNKSDKTIIDNFNISPVFHNHKLIMLGAQNIYVFDLKSNNLNEIKNEGILQL